MATITYKDISRTYTNINVYVDGRVAGAIKQDGLMFFYLPKGTRIRDVGERFHSIRSVKNSLEQSS